ncbi:hypothetical protein DFH07DRAFT_939983 [Mycena maculata]|uniref:Uncharacterized protein n=1 Tax=Mycena maculata TaxID=230809 RepID=A0AAD7JA90_9AGAR|nr:hypothetical protein DFH07DRAFT_939983 [Mycena maculata]
MAPKATPKTSPKPRPFAPTVSMALRPKRAAQPGALDMPQEKRSHEQTQKDKQAEDDKKRQAAAKKKQGIVNVAAIENKTAAEDKTRDEQANHPPTTLMAKVLRRRPETAPNADIIEGEIIDPISDGPGSSDEYRPDKEDEDEQMDPSEDEQGAGPAPKPTGRAKKLPKGAYRTAVDDERKKQAGSTSSEAQPPQSKRKAVTADASKARATKKIKETPVGGLRDGWGRGRTPAVDSFDARSASSAMSVDARGRSKSGGSTMSVDRGGYSSSDAGFGPTSDASNFGGIESDVDDGEEQSEMADEKGKSARTKVSSLAGIVDTDAPGLVPLRHQPEQRLQKSKINLNHLPEAIRAEFRTSFTPSLLEHAGRIPAWTDPSPGDILRIWETVFPDYAPTTERAKMIVLKLAEDRIYSWRHNLADVGVDVLQNTWIELELKNPEEIKETVEFYLKGDNDRSRVYYYETYENEDGEVDPKVFARTLAAHFTAIAEHLSEGCSGLGGPGAQAGKQNWGDHTEYHQGQAIEITSTSTIAGVIDKLSANRWERIVAAARSIASKGKSKPKQFITDPISDGASSEDFELIDNESDW